MPASTVQSGTVAIMGPPDSDGSFFARYTLTLSDGSILSVDRPHELAGTNTTTTLAAIEANVNAQLAVVPSPVTGPQARQQLTNSGLKTQFEAQITGATALTQSVWYTAKFVNRNDAYFVTAMTAIGQTSAQMDDFFRAASLL